jgi:hypothetical protein
MLYGFQPPFRVNNLVAVHLVRHFKSMLVLGNVEQNQDLKYEENSCFFL